MDIWSPVLSAQERLGSEHLTFASGAQCQVDRRDWKSSTDLTRLREYDAIIFDLDRYRGEGRAGKKFEQCSHPSEGP